MKDFLKARKIKYITFALIILMLIVAMIFSRTLNIMILSSARQKDILYKKDNFFLHFVSVGSADCAMINFPTGEIAIIDTGSQSSINSVISYLNRMVINNKNNDVIDYLFLSHADDDHIGGAWNLLSQYKVKNVIRPQQYLIDENTDNEHAFRTDSEAYTKVVEKINEKNINSIFALDNMEFSIGNVKIKILYPIDNYSDSNDYSYFIKITYKEKVILFTGDASKLTEHELISLHPDELKADVLKVAHHGASTSSSNEFLEKVKPQYAIISVGKNIYGHPTSETLENLQYAGTQKILRTDTMGDILLEISDEITCFTGNYTFSNFVGVEKVSAVLLVMIITYVCFEMLNNLVFKRNIEKR